MSGPEGLICDCMAVGRRYKNYNEQMQAEMEQASKSSNTSEDYSRPRYVETEPAGKVGRVQITTGNKSMNGFTGIFLMVFGLIYLLVSIFITTVMIMTSAPWETFLFISIFYAVGICTFCGGIVMIIRSRRVQK